MGKFRIANSILFWGALWGVFESTVGCLLHLLPVSIGYMIWFPAALFFMDRVYKATGKMYSVLLIAVFAASIKLLNLFMPVRVDKVINPAISIILEAVTVFSVYYTYNKFSRENKLSKAIAVSVIWRLLYLVYLLFVPEWMYTISALADRAKLIKFLLIESGINALTVYVYYVIQSAVLKKASGHTPRKTRFAFMPLITIFLIAADVAATLYL